jgi:RHH-type rel operon transcriptional repressor/antitoxin RelB
MFFVKLGSMELHLSPEKEALLQQIANRTGRPKSDLLEEAVDRFLDYDTWFIREVEKGLAEANRGELIDHEEVIARIEKRIQAKQVKS